jgi:hypothetical protein
MIISVNSIKRILHSFLQKYQNDRYIIPTDSYLVVEIVGNSIEHIYIRESKESVRYSIDASLYEI